jgi:hypothetical protein
MLSASSAPNVWLDFWAFNSRDLFLTTPQERFACIFSVQLTQTTGALIIPDEW